MYITTGSLGVLFVALIRRMGGIVRVRLLAVDDRAEADAVVELVAQSLRRKFLL
jgi:hypothetical protein